MNLQIRPANPNDLAVIVHLSLLAWEPVFDSFRQVLGNSIFTMIFPDWRKNQTETVETFCTPKENFEVWVGEVEGEVVGFFVNEYRHAEKTGEVHLLAVHPAHQNRGIGTELNNFALAKMREHGMKLATVGTGGDPGHAPARRAYEKAGYIALPAVHYYQEL